MNADQALSKSGEPLLKNMVPWISFLIFFAVLNETVFNVSTPMLSKQFGLTPSGVSWMMTIFMVFFGIGSVIFGKLSDIFSLRTLILTGIIIYVGGSLLGFFLQFSYPLVVVSRAIQGVGCSAIPALVFIVVARYYPVSERGKIFGFITSVVSFSIGIGPVIGGFVSGSLHWSLLFLIPAVLLIAIPFFRKALPKEAKREGKIDLLGAVLVALTVGFLVIALNINQWYYLVAFVVSLVLFVIRILTAASPFIEPALFKNVPFRNGVVVGFCLFSIVIGVMFLVPLMLAGMHRLNTTEIGLILFPGAISSVFFGPLAGTLADKRGNNFVVAIGLALLVIGMLFMAALMSLSALIVAGGMLLVYVGFSLFQTAMMNSISQTLPAHETGIGMGLFNLIGIISGAIGTALVGKILDEKWFNYSVVPLATMTRGMEYSNLILVFSIVVLLGGWLYFSSPKTPQSIASLEDEPSGACVDCT